jgi:molybdopterin converting factor small subunit
MGTSNDSITVRKNIVKLKNKSLTLSKQIISELDAWRNNQTEMRQTARQEYQKQRKVRKQLQEQFQKIYARLQTLSNEITAKEQKYPIEELNNITITMNSDQQHSNQSTLQQLQEQKQPILVAQYDEDQLILDEDEEKDLEVEEDLNDLVAIFDALTDSVLEQEEKVEVITDNVQSASNDVQQGTAHLQKAAKYAGLAGATIVGGIIGAAVGGPVGMVVGANIAIGAGAAIGTGAAVGLGLGAIAGYGGNKLSYRVNSVTKKLKNPWRSSTTTSESNSVEEEDITEEDKKND